MKLGACTLNAAIIQLCSQLRIANCELRIVPSSPSELDSVQIDELVKTMCLAWAGNKFGNPNHAVNSYQKHVIDAVLRGVSEMEAIQVWMEGALAQLPELSVHH
ncbi:hypothetical protein ANSO36C_64440 (plasmid) [Nostoc cf. commune SO-36]|uniref:Uncharacterized protein n=1 Tax=Nostoc cf. commune SO-36 TaxID=449208 RepID=A0ABM7ZBI6_NOSCO|nr:hypothetical protein ANSO36C_64440 [Nostoc cf. commune SO-36]